MSDLEVRQLRYFVAVAEELNFGRAAARLGMAQPPLSRAIRDLERQLGVVLFTRTTRQVALTAAGEGFLLDARTALDAVTAAAGRVRNAARPSPTLRVALKADYDAGLLPSIIAAFGEEQPHRVEVLMGGRGAQIPALREGRADVALLPLPFDDRGIDYEPLLTEPRVVALSASDPLAAHDSLRRADLAGRVLPDGSPADRDRPATAPPSPLDLAQIFNLIELGTMVLFPPESLTQRYVRPNIAYRPVVDLSPSTLVVAWPQTSHSAAVAAFVRAAVAAASVGAASPVAAFPTAASPVAASPMAADA
jgi:DNA-binding transcriptional LysR family regulator